jgi:hypothetical protein
MLIRNLPAAAGPLWLRDGWRLFKRQPLGLPAMVVIYQFILALPLVLPLVNVVAFGILWPFASLGMMTACREVAAGRAPTPSLFALPFQDRAHRVLMFRLGVMTAVLLLLAALATQLTLPPRPDLTDEEALKTMSTAQLLMPLLFLLPAFIVTWFAPMLTGWHGVGPVKAMFGSVVALWRNLGAVLLYAIAAALAFTVLTLLSAWVFDTLTTSRTVALMALAPVVLVLMTIAQASLYPMYASIFEQE